MSFAREALDSAEFQSVVNALKKIVDEEGGLSIEEWRTEDTRVLYELGFNLYRTKEFLHAESIFRKLVVMMPLEKTHWQGLASSMQMQNRFKDALTGWSMYAFIDPKSPLPHFHAAECLLSIEDYKDCLKALDALAERDVQDEFYEKAQTLQERCLSQMEAYHDSH